LCNGQRYDRPCEHRSMSLEDVRTWGDGTPPVTAGRQHSRCDTKQLVATLVKLVNHLQNSQCPSEVCFHLGYSTTRSGLGGPVGECFSST
jgi:hypothetical protein